VTTVTEAVLGAEISDARMYAVSVELLMKLVARALPFHSTTDPDTNPVPFTASENAAPPGAAASGLKGWLIKGTGFTAEAAVILIDFEAPAIEAVTVSVAVMVWPPSVFSVAEKIAVPLGSVELAGSTAWTSVLVKCTVPE
jgi:hypothetical protein